MQFPVSVPASPAMRFVPRVHATGTLAPSTRNAEPSRVPAHASRTPESEADFVDQHYRRWLKWSGVL